MPFRKHRSGFPISVERRAQERGDSPNVEQELRKTTPAGEVATVRPDAALTRRERRVKKLLLKELKRHSSWRTLTYAEKQHLEKRLNVAFIDKELAQMRKALRWMTPAVPVLGVIAVALVLFSGISLASGNPFDFEVHLQWQINTVIYAVAAIGLTRSTRRKMFIYEALRELSDADEIDVTLSRAVVEADVLIDRIVEKELEADRRYLEPLSRRTN